jgi:hypothetical protein
MLHPSYPQHPFRIREQTGAHQIFCEARKKWVRLTPEEWVRQNTYQWLIQTHFYPAALIALEKEIELSGMKKRFDLLVYNKQHQPWMMVECKQQSQPLNERVLLQALRYNIALPVPFLLLTNGAEACLIELTEGTWKVLSEMPVYV